MATDLFRPEDHRRAFDLRRAAPLCLGQIDSRRGTEDCIELPELRAVGDAAERDRAAALPAETRPVEYDSFGRRTNVPQGAENVPGVVSERPQGESILPI